MPDPKTGHFTGLAKNKYRSLVIGYECFQTDPGPDAQMSIPIDDYEKESLPSNY
jgi:hypothetical protein